jgi:DNA polymerase (family X)
MPSNAEAAGLLREIADLLDLNGERFKPEAYRRAARSIETLSEELAAVAGRGGLREVPGVGEAIEEKLREYLATGRIDYLERLRREVPVGLLELMRLPGVGPKTTRRFWTELGVTGRSELGGAVDAGRLDGLKGFGPRKIQQIRAALEATATGPGALRVPIETVYSLALSIRETLRTRAPTERVEIAGSFRRCRESVGDLDVLVTSDGPEKVFDVFSALPEVAEVRMRGGTKETVVLRSGLQVDLRVVEPGAFGAALQYFTGSKDHNVRLRSLARDRGLKINEYGVFRGEERIGGRTEEEVYDRLGLPWIPPELREDHGEIDDAREGRLPALIEARDLVGDLHVHLGKDAHPDDLDGLRDRAKALGLGYVGVVLAVPGPDGRLVSGREALGRAVRTNRSGRVRTLAVAEVNRDTPREDVTRANVDYLVLRPPAPGTAPAGTRGLLEDVRLLAHFGGPAAEAHRSLELARELGAAIETGPGIERIDSSAARTAREMGIPLAVPTGVGEIDGSATREIALGFARRAAATRTDVANAGPWSERAEGRMSKRSRRSRAG